MATTLGHDDSLDLLADSTIVPSIEEVNTPTSGMVTPLPRRTRTPRSVPLRSPGDTLATPSKPKCAVEECPNKALYGHRSGTDASPAPTYCKAHKEPTMISFVHRLCIAPGCTHRPNFTDSPSSREPMYCKTHKGKDSVYIEGKRCRGALNPPDPNSTSTSSDGTASPVICNVLPSFNFPNLKTPLFCKKHKQDGMIDVLNPRCKAEGCQRRRTFNWPGEKPMWCKEHSQEKMVNVRNQKSSGSTPVAAPPSTPITHTSVSTATPLAADPPLVHSSEPDLDIPQTNLPLSDDNTIPPDLSSSPARRGRPVVSSRTEVSRKRLESLGSSPSAQTRNVRPRRGVETPSATSIESWYADPTSPSSKI